MKQIIIMFRYVIGIIIMSLMVLLCPLMCSIIESQTDIITRFLDCIMFVFLCVLMGGVSIKIIQETRGKWG